MAWTYNADDNGDEIVTNPEFMGGIKFSKVQLESEKERNLRGQARANARIAELNATIAKLNSDLTKIQSNIDEIDLGLAEFPE